MPQGYALRNKGGCPTPAESGGSTWDNFYTCCPPDTYNKPNQYNTICRQGVNQPTLTQCANTTWNLYAWDNTDDDAYEYFCCLQGLQGFYSKENSTYGYFGCVNSTDIDTDTMGTLEIAVTGTSSATATATSTSSTTSTSTTASATTTSSSDTTASDGGSSSNTGAIVGGVVGGVCGAALIAVLVWLIFRYRARAAKGDQSTETAEISNQQQPLYSDNPTNSNSAPSQPSTGSHARSGLQSPSELSPGEPSELNGDSPGQQYGFYELESEAAKRPS
ncbi:hypothetical protein N7532_009451 [Penicillium argentinense]|uniref:Uncharacterized protein n=1 Tax=Penicillium argentinense TaxID=1131581 RepID=A0A9W9K3H2_9EURO|nr:uncharacterized protein N7532_009451 [Penicillium argentinense]KAJ5090767.1 hypothetical protein N7532_009451 [Penicillium argentinense]